jgi:tetratricopeptide (TPR) repeat protein
MTLLLTLRGDFYGRAIAADRELSDALGAGQVNLGPMKQEELRAAIVEPAKRVGLSFETGLVDRILEDVGEEPGNLPLLEYALTELWNRRSGNKLTFDAYNASGQVMGAIAERAETVFAKFSADEQKTARRLFTRLVRVASAGEEGSDTRRRARRGELREEGWKLVEIFAGQQNRLLVASLDPVTGEDTAEVAHEALIRNWKRLRDWIEEDRDFLLWRQQLRLYLSAWQASEKRDEGTLLRGAVFEEAYRWLRARGEELSQGEREFIEKSGRAVRVSKVAVRSTLAIAALIILAAVGWFFYTRTDTYQIKTILTPDIESQILTSGESYVRAYTVAMIVLGKGDEAEQIALRVPDPNQRLRTLIPVAGALIETGRAEDAANLLRQAEQIGLEITDPADRSAALIPVAGAMAGTGKIEEAVQIALRIPEPEDQCNALISIAQSLMDKGDGAQADKLLGQAEQIALQMPGFMRRAMSLVEISEALLKRGSDQEAENLLQQVRQISLQVTDPDDRWQIMNAIAASLVRTGKGVEADDPLQQAGQAALQIPDYDERADALIATTELMAKAGKADDARRLALQIQDPPSQSRALASVTEALARSGRVDEAQAVATLQISNPDYVIDTLGPVIDALVKAGKIEEARQVVLRQTQENQIQPILFSILARSLVDAGKVDEAQTVVTQIQMPAYERAMALSSIARALAKIGKAKEAARLLEGAKQAAFSVEKRLLRSQALVSVGSVMAILHQYREARLIGDAITMPQRKFAVYAYGLIEYAKQKNPGLAKSLEVDPKFPYPSMQ